MLYSMAVTFPIPVASGWHVRLLQRLHDVLTNANFEHKNVHVLLLWLLFVVNITAVDHLVLCLWSDNACNEGGLAVWNALRPQVVPDETPA